MYSLFMTKELGEVSVCCAVNEEQTLIEIHFHSEDGERLEYERVKEALSHALEMVKKNLENPDPKTTGVH